MSSCSSSHFCAVPGDALITARRSLREADTFDASTIARRCWSGGADPRSGAQSVETRACLRSPLRRSIDFQVVLPRALRFVGEGQTLEPAGAVEPGFCQPRIQLHRAIGHRHSLRKVLRLIADSRAGQIGCRQVTQQPRVRGGDVRGLFQNSYRTARISGDEIGNAK